MKYDFDELVERRGTNCVKWDEEGPCQTDDRCSSKEMIPLWVADMDFKVAPAIQEAVRKRAEHGVFGYNIVPESYYEAVIAWFRRRHQWDIHREWLLYTTAVVPAMSCVIKALTMPGEKVLILSPAYNCFFSSIKNNGCEVLESPLKAADDSFEVDFIDFESKCADEKTTLFLLCNPHNPTGRVWTREELQRMYDICHRHGVKVVSDEIHCELIMPGYRFVPFGTVTDDCVVMNSPSKSFNTAGLQIANIICSHPTWRRRIDRAININEVCDVNPFGIVALQAAYNESEDWIDELNQYLWGNYQSIRDFIEENIPQWKVCRLEGTYLPWVDVSAMGITSQQLCNRLFAEAKVWINPGTMYGRETGEGYVRLNIACPRSRLMDALQRIETVVNPCPFT
ncbi:MalY/PatB family protein [Prevotella sp. lc2012]|uniref:MalY/PatB family protein n=1 Tax=Prevotella sp. lc2012 TaxID=1761886 RepID=UPI000894C6D4|nr:MalY/PatB family protein [Prevotella sp. lc2012]MBR5988537.1 pyridoxal phosphate-dependent aminotransferase [Prevotella sp.]SEE55156.1 cystathione beta-lyase [Prevotella sp. lc2012]